MKRKVDIQKEFINKNWFTILIAPFCFRIPSNASLRNTKELQTQFTLAVYFQTLRNCWSIMLLNVVFDLASLTFFRASLMSILQTRRSSSIHNFKPGIYDEFIIRLKLLNIFSVYIKNKHRGMRSIRLSTRFSLGLLKKRKTIIVVQNHVLHHINYKIEVLIISIQYHVMLF